MPQPQRKPQQQSKITYLPDMRRLLPQSPDAEQGVLGSALIAPQHAMPICMERITTAHFHVPAHAAIYDVLLEFWKENEPVDMITLTQVLRDRQLLEAIGGAHFVTSLFTLLPSAANLSNYVDIVREKYILRQIISTFTEFAGKAYEEQENATELLTASQNALLDIVRIAEGRRNDLSIKELVMRATERLQDAIDSTGEIAMPTGLHDLDYITQGLRAPEVTVIAGKPSSGKTVLAMNIAEELALRRGKRIGIVSMEMSGDQLTDRLLAAVAWTNIRDIKRDRHITEGQSEKICEAASKIAASHIFIRDEGQLSMPEISATLSMWKATHGLDIGIIDHAQLVRSDGKTNGRTEEVEQVSRALKPLAKRLNIPLIVLSQVSEDTKGDYSTKNSRALLEDADNVWFINHGEGSFIHVSKQRDGENDRPVPVNFVKPLSRFTNKAKTEENPTASSHPPRTNKR